MKFLEIVHPTLCVMYHVSCVTCHVSPVTCQNIVLKNFLINQKKPLKKLVNVVEVDGGGSVISGAYPIYFFKNPDGFAWVC